MSPSRKLKPRAPNELAIGKTCIWWGAAKVNPAGSRMVALSAHFLQANDRLQSFTVNVPFVSHVIHTHP